MNVKRLRHKLQTSLDRAKDITDYHRIVTKFLHIMDNGQIERTLIAIGNLYNPEAAASHRTLFVETLSGLAPYIKDKQLSHIPPYLAQYSFPILLRTMPGYHKKISWFLRRLNLLQFLSRILVVPNAKRVKNNEVISPSSLYRYIRQKWISQMGTTKSYSRLATEKGLNYDAHDIICNTRSVNSDIVYRLFFYGYISAWSPARAINVINMLLTDKDWITSFSMANRRRHNAPTKIVPGINLIHSVASFSHYRVIESMLRDILEFFDSPSCIDSIVKEAREKIARQTSRMRSILKQGALFARISSDIKIRLAMLFDKLPTKHTFSEAEYEAILHAKVAAGLKEL